MCSSVQITPGERAWFVATDARKIKRLVYGRSGFDLLPALVRRPA
jgi:hypothetical protein